MISAIFLFGSGVSLLATLIDGLKHLFNSFALSRYAHLGYSEYGFFCFLDRGFRLALVFQKQTSFDFVLLARLKRWVF